MGLFKLWKLRKQNRKNYPWVVTHDENKAIEKMLNEALGDDLIGGTIVIKNLTNEIYIHYIPDEWVYIGKRDDLLKDAKRWGY